MLNKTIIKTEINDKFTQHILNKTKSKFDTIMILNYLTDNSIADLHKYVNQFEIIENY